MTTAKEKLFKDVRMDGVRIDARAIRYDYTSQFEKPSIKAGCYLAKRRDKFTHTGLNCFNIGIVLYSYQPTWIP